MVAAAKTPEEVEKKGEISPSSPAVGNLTTLAEGQVLLPRFVLERSDGLYVDLSMLDSGQEFIQFAERAFTSDNLFSNLDYPTFLKLLYQPESEELLKLASGSKERPEVRFASGIGPFPKLRRSIYRDVRIAPDGSRAEYIFEPVLLDVAEQLPIYGPPDENGITPITGYEMVTQTIKARTDLDEFIAAMWLRGIRFGLDLPQITRAIGSEKPERLDVARSLPATPGVDASVEEKSEALHRNDAPAILASGKMDLRTFQNRFPQVAIGTRLMRKVPRITGKAGWNVQGKPLEPDLPRDFDISSLAGPGTRVDRNEEGEFLVATMTGFLNIDAESSSLSVTEKIINKTGVNMRTTGNLTLTGSEFEEHGEVQEKREVHGMHMDFMADVFGHILSAGGNVVLHKNLAGGSIHNPGGMVAVEGKVSQAVIEAKGGAVQLETAESSRIIASRIKIGKAINCEILGEFVEIGQALGSAIAGKTVVVENSGTFRAQESMVSVLLPDLTWWNGELASLAEEKNSLETRHNELVAEQAAFAQQPAVAKYLAIQRKVKAGEIKLTSEQENSLKEMAARLAPILKQIAQHTAETMKLAGQLKILAETMADKEAEKQAALSHCSCKITHVQGDTVVRQWTVNAQGFPLATPLATITPKELHVHLREHGRLDDQLFADDCGQVDWQPLPGQ